MKTQISGLRSGTKNQLLNDAVDYSALMKATTHNGHAGSNHKEVSEIWGKVKAENPDELIINFKGLGLVLDANKSLSGKSVSYVGYIFRRHLLSYFGLDPADDYQPYIMIDNANSITVSNGKNSYIYICPSLIQIL